MDLSNKTELEQYFAEHFDTVFFPILADIYKKEGDYKRAKKVCEIGLEYHPSNVEGSFVMAEINQLEGDLYEAERFFKNILSVEPLHYRGAVNLVKIQMELKRSPETIAKLWRKIARINPTHTEAKAFLMQQLDVENKSSVQKAIKKEQKATLVKPEVVPANNQEKVVTEKQQPQSVKKSEKLSSTNEQSEPEKILNPKPPTIKPQKISEEDLQALDITPRMATFTMVNILKKQKLYPQALSVLKMLEDKGADKALIHQERQTIQELLVASEIK